MSLPSRALKNATARMTGERDFLRGIKKDIELANEIRRGMETPFGAAVYAALEDIERAAYSVMANTSPWMIHKQIAARAELTVAQYIKSKLGSYVVNANALLANIDELSYEGSELMEEGIGNAAI